MKRRKELKKSLLKKELMFKKRLIMRERKEFKEKDLSGFVMDQREPPYLRGDLLKGSLWKGADITHRALCINRPKIEHPFLSVTP